MNGKRKRSSSTAIEKKKEQRTFGALRFSSPSLGRGDDDFLHTLTPTCLLIRQGDERGGEGGEGGEGREGEWAVCGLLNRLGEFARMCSQQTTNRLPSPPLPSLPLSTLLLLLFIVILPHVFLP